MLNFNQSTENLELKGEFSLWCHISNESPKKKKDINSTDYEETLSKIATFKDIPSFWNVIQHMKKTSDLENGIEYQLFKKDIKPIWEDEKNIHGGKFTILLTQKYSGIMWEEMIISFCNGSIPYFDEINGVCISIRKNYHIAQFWFKKFDKTLCCSIRNSLKSFFMIPPVVNMKMKTFLKLEKNYNSKFFNYA